MQFFSQDEDVAFEKRMRGDIPSTPLLGGDKIGAVIVKAISDKSERFQTADDFIAVLEDAVNNTPAEILNEKIKFDMTSHMESEKKVAKNYRETIGDEELNKNGSETLEDETNSSLNKCLFESMGEVHFEERQEEKVVEPTEAEEQKADKSNEKSDKKVKKNISIAATDSSEIWVFITPIIITVLGICTFFVVIPNIYGKTISFADWLFSSPQNIINTLNDSNAVLTKVGSIIGMKVVWWCWLLTFGGSLFMLGRKLQAKPKINTNASLHSKEPYFMISDIIHDIDYMLNFINRTKDADSLRNNLKRLEEKLYIESDFGCGKNDVIECENQIRKQIECIQKEVKYINIKINQVEDKYVEQLRNAGFSKEIMEMNMGVKNIDALLRKRTELKKR